MLQGFKCHLSSGRNIIWTFDWNDAELSLKGLHFEPFKLYLHQSSPISPDIEPWWRWPHETPKCDGLFFSLFFFKCNDEIKVFILSAIGRSLFLSSNSSMFSFPSSFFCVEIIVGPNRQCKQMFIKVISPHRSYQKNLQLTTLLSPYICLKQ